MSQPKNELKVLFACGDDDRQALLAIQKTLPELMSWEFITDGATAIEHLADPAARYDLAVVSTQLPGVEIIEFSHQLRAAEPQMPVIVLGEYDERFIQALTEFRIDDFIARDPHGDVFKILPSLLDHMALKHGTDIPQTPAVERRVSSLLDTIPDIVFELAVDGTIIHANREAEALGWPLNLLGEIKMEELIVDEDVPRARENLQKLLQGEKLTLKNSYRVRTTEGNIIPLQVQTLLLNKPGEVPRILGVAKDISELEQARTEQKRLEEQLRRAQKMEAVGRLAGGIAHDFNNILTGIHGYTELVMSELGNENRLYQDMEEIKAASERAARLVQQLLAFSRKQIVEPQVIDANASLEKMATILVPLLGEEIQFDFHPSADLWRIKADPSQIEQVLVNLVTNARDAISGPGEVTLRTANQQVHSRRDDFGGEHKPGPYVMISISDSGEGMGHGTLQHIFEPFFTTKQVDQGTGLGLSMVYGVVKQNRGFVEVESSPGLGSTFRLFFPQAMESLDQEPARPRSQEARGQETILLVEDEDVVRVLARAVLTRHGYKVIEAGDGESAYQLCKELKDPIDLVLTDVIMPNMNGKELYDALKKLRPSLKGIFMSGYTADSIAEKGVVEEGINFVQKPFSVKALAAKIREVLDSDE